MGSVLQLTFKQRNLRELWTRYMFFHIVYYFADLIKMSHLLVSVFSKIESATSVLELVGRKPNP